MEAAIVDGTGSTLHANGHGLAKVDIHGLGFVGALKVITISRSELILSLASFNIGIELGQIVVVALAMLLFWSIRNYAWTTKLNHVFSAGVAVLGVIWLGQRVLG